jgi:hypothetical protein
MNTHKLNPQRALADMAPLPVAVAFQHDFHDLGDTIIKSRALRALEDVAARYPIYRVFRCAASRRLEVVFDDLALQSGLTALRLDEGSLLLEGPHVFVRAKGARKAGYCSCYFSVWADSVSRVEELREQLLRIVGDRYRQEQTFTIDWYFNDSCYGLTSTSFDELVLDDLYDEAYPSLCEPVARFVDRYLAASETVLVLQGSPGTGKTRLVRAILSEISKRKDDSARVLYTADRKALESDEIFVEFITGSHDAFVIEDADHLLLARSNGNHDLHRFLAIADGVVRAQGRKIIFTTNLANVSDIDEALLRPGRCFANVRTRNLTRAEAAALLQRMSQSGACGAALDEVFQPGMKDVSVAQLYRACAPTATQTGAAAAAQAITALHAG